MIADCTAIILAGGDSQRMGGDKANLVLGEQTLLQHVITTMRELFPEVAVCDGRHDAISGVVRAESFPPGFWYRRFWHRQKGRGLRRSSCLNS